MLVLLLGTLESCWRERERDVPICMQERERELEKKNLLFLIDCKKGVLDT